MGGKMNGNFNAMIKKWRKESGLTLEEVAKCINITPQGISLYENEKRMVGFETLQLFADFFQKEIIVTSRDKGIPLTEEQRMKVKNICKYNKWVRDIYEKLKELFDITEEEIQASKLFDDMTMDEYIRYSPIQTEFDELGNCKEINVHQEEVFFYYYCLNAEFSLENGEITGIVFPNSIPDFTPPRRISNDEFITEQRRLLLPLLRECFAFNEVKKTSFYDMVRLKKEIGF